MARSDLIKTLNTKHPKLKRIQIEKIVDTFFTSILNALYEKKNVYIRGFGTFISKEIKENFSARDPRSGELIYAPKRNRVRFKISKKLSEFINK